MLAWAGKSPTDIEVRERETKAGAASRRLSSKRTRLAGKAGSRAWNLRGPRRWAEVPVQVHGPAPLSALSGSLRPPGHWFWENNCSRLNRSKGFGADSCSALQPQDLAGLRGLGCPPPPVPHASSQDSPWHCWLAGSPRSGSRTNGTEELKGRGASLAMDPRGAPTT
ncbi:hypothetical protein GQ53DRAFT_749412 [Thozetella sp. PMI_491]|nr:hypothetical protein GQ53DRAFT_749412 [Thozetella sp. PMI_491]